jgi:dTDP-4-dehydrorhamnose reductase
MFSTDKKILVTGTTSGLGKYIHRMLPNSISLNRENKEQVIKDEYDLIIHCAFSNERGKDINDYYEFIDGSILLTNELVKVKHKKFIYISSLEIYNEPFTSYRFVKLCSESIVFKRAKSFLILRISALLGVDIRKTTVYRILKENKPKLTLSEDSIFNYILHSDLFEFIFEDFNRTGIVNFISDGNITLGRVNEIFNGNTVWGNYKYTIKDAYLRAVKESVKIKTSEEVVKEFKKIMEDNKL